MSTVSSSVGTAVKRGANDLKARAVKSVGWFVANRLWTQCLSWGVTIVLARLLSPADYGLFAMAYAVIAFLELFQQFGFGTVIIQRQDLTARHLNTIFWLTAGASLVMAALTWVAARPAAAYYAEPRLVPLIQALVVVFLLEALGLVPYSLLTKAIDFRRRSLAESVSVTISTLATLALAWQGWQVWALVAGQLARVAIRNIMLFILAGWRPGLMLTRRGMRDILRFGLNVATGALLRQVSHLVNTAVIGRLLGPAALGVWSMAATLGTNPFNRLSTTIIQQLSLPVFSAVQNDVALLRRYFLRVTRYLALVSFPLQAGMAIVASDLVVVLLSPRWHDVTLPLQILVIGGLMQLMSLPAPSVLTARNRTSVILRFSAAILVAGVVSCFVGAHWGLIGVAVANVSVTCALRAVLLVVAMREIRLSPGTFLANLLPPMIASLAMVAAVGCLQLALAAPGPAEPRLLRDVLVGVLVYTGTLLILDRGLATEVRHLLAVMRTRREAST